VAQLVRTQCIGITLSHEIVAVKVQSRILVEIVGEVEKIWGRCSGLAHGPHGMLGL
jgi:hypothetical protein